jgi:hypothetical protein
MFPETLAFFRVSTSYLKVMPSYMTSRKIASPPGVTGTYPIRPRA